MMRKFLLSGHW